MRVETLGSRLARERQTAGLSQLAVAEAIGVTQPTYSFWERDVSEPGGRHLPAIMEWLGIGETELGLLIVRTKLKMAEME